jgi:hypothetical protein
MHAPWSASYLAPKPTTIPPARGADHACAGDARVVVTSDEPSPVTVTLLDHHRDPIAPPLTLDVKPGDPTVFAFELPKAVLESSYGVEGFELKIGALRIPSSP